MNNGDLNKFNLFRNAGRSYVTLLFPIKTNLIEKYIQTKLNKNERKRL